MTFNLHTALLNYLKAQLKDLEIPDSCFYNQLRDDSKEKSLAVFSLGTLSDIYTYGEQVNYRKDFQIQIVYGTSISDAQSAADYIYQSIIVKDNGKIKQDGYEFYIIPHHNRSPIYLGQIGNGNHCHAIECEVIFVRNNED